jgi:hypothetical protein
MPVDRENFYFSADGARVWFFGGIEEFAGERQATRWRPWKRSAEAGELALDARS